MVTINNNPLRKNAAMKRDTAEIILTARLSLLHAVVGCIFDLDEPLQRICLALLAVSERQSGNFPEGVLIQPVNLHAEHFEGYLPPDASLTSLLRRLQLENPQVSIPALEETGHIQSKAPLFEIVSSLELAGRNPRVNWWVRAGQWSQWGLTPFDRHLLCRFAMTVITRKDTAHHRLLALLLLSVALRVEGAFKSEPNKPEAPVQGVEISINTIRDDLASLEKMLKVLPEKTDLDRQSRVAIGDFVSGNLFHYTDTSHKSVQVLPFNYSQEGEAGQGED